MVMIIVMVIIVIMAEIVIKKFKAIVQSLDDR